MPPQPEPSSPNPDALPELAAFLAGQREHITGLWLEAVRQHPRLGASDNVSDAELVDHLPKLFEDLEASLRGGAVAETLSHNAEQHGEHRWRQHYGLEEVLKELGIVCRPVLKEGLSVFARKHSFIPPEPLDAARERILQFFEEAAAGSVRRYADKQREALESAHFQTREAQHSHTVAVQSDYERLADLFRNAPSFLAVLRGPDHVFHLANDQYARITGHRTLIGQPVREALPEVVDQGYIELLDRVYTTGEPHVGRGVRILLQSEPGARPTEHFIDFVYMPTHTADGRIDGIVVHGVDWTERRHAQQAAVELSEQRRLALDSAHMGWWNYDVGSGVVSCDNQFRVLYDVDKEADVYALFLSRVHPEDQGLVDDGVKAALRVQDPAPYALDYRVLHLDGTVRWVAARGQAVFVGESTERRAVRLAGTLADITEERRATQTLASKEAASRFLADLGEATRQTADPDAVLGVVVDSLQKHLATDRCAYVEMEEDQNTFTIRYDRVNPAGSNRSLVGRYRLTDFGQGMLPLLRAGKTVAVADVANDPLLADARESMAAVDVAAAVNVPLVKAGKLVAILAVNDLRPRRWTADEVALIEVGAKLNAPGMRGRWRRAKRGSASWLPANGPRARKPSGSAT